MNVYKSFAENDYIFLFKLLLGHVICFDHVICSTIMSCNFYAFFNAEYFFNMFTHDELFSINVTLSFYFII